MELDKNKISLPLIVTRGFIMFPHNNASLDIIKEESEKAVNRSQNFYDGYLILSSQINTKTSDNSYDNIYKIGCLCEVTSNRSNPDGSMKVSLRAISRVRIDDIAVEEGLFAHGAIIDEIADVEIMLNQLIIIHSCRKEVEERIDFKIDRQIERLKNYE